MRIFSVPFCVVLAVLVTACGGRLLNGPDTRIIIERGMDESTRTVWNRLSERARELGLILTEVRPDEGIIQFDWITAPGDARLYLQCDVYGSVGSAFLRPRIRIYAAEDGSRVVVTSEVRATTTETCQSNGRFETWLLGRLDASPEFPIDEQAGSPAAGEAMDPDSVSFFLDTE